MQLIQKVILFFENKWKVKGWDLFFVFLSFSLAGPTVLVVRPFIFQLSGLSGQAIWLKAICYPFIMIPVFYFFLLIYGCCFGQCKFFKYWVKGVGVRLIRK